MRREEGNAALRKAGLAVVALDRHPLLLRRCDVRRDRARREVALLHRLVVGIAGLERLHLIRVRVSDPEEVGEGAPFATPVEEPRAVTSRPKIDACLFDARVPA